MRADGQKVDYYELTDESLKILFDEKIIGDIKASRRYNLYQNQKFLDLDLNCVANTFLANFLRVCYVCNCFL